MATGLLRAKKESFALVAQAGVQWRNLGLPQVTGITGMRHHT
ncbi:HKR1 isoform 18 [Pan troglodytes]|uniref:Zinc finger protein 875 n=2 Tax=Homininae TaxID=207598 RepID=K7EMJ9_HUMAN|nr:HKR1 isoform 18 [Pan troglodytes]